jgi:hypothetical protein
MRHTLSILFKLSVTVLSGYGLYLTLFTGGVLIENFSYFTTQANFWTWLTYMIFTLQLIIKKPLGKRATYFKQLWMVMLILTSVVYSFVLIPYLSINQIDYPIASIKDLIIHYAVPASVVMDYILFDKKGQFEKNGILKNAIFPILYLLYIVIFIWLGGRFTLGGTVHLFPYFFLDYQVLGVIPVIALCLSIVGFILYLSWLIYIVDYIIGQKLDHRF